MKKKYSFCGIIAILAILAVTVVYDNDVCVNGSSLSRVMLNENIEALTETLEEVTIVCGGREHKGPCWKEGYEMKMCSEYMYYQCEATGNPSDKCTEPCK